MGAGRSSLRAISFIACFLVVSRKFYMNKVNNSPLRQDSEGFVSTFSC